MRAIDARNAFVMTQPAAGGHALGHRGARRRRALKRPDIYGKTGTTNDSLDAWFAGFQPERGRPSSGWATTTPRKLGDRETGGGLALPVWIDYMATVLQGRAGAGAGRRPKAWSTSAASGSTRSTRAVPA